MAISSNFHRQQETKERKVDRKRFRDFESWHQSEKGRTRSLKAGKKYGWGILGNP